MRVWVAATAVTVLMAGCTGRSTVVTTTTDRTVTATVTHSSPAPAFTPKPATSVPPLPPGASPAAGEVERRCPYIASTPDENPDANVADYEGDRVYRTTVLTRHEPVGCRFYFWADPWEAIADIVPETFATPTQAYDAMVLTGRAGTQVMGQKNIIPGVDAVLFRTRFFGSDGARDWACAFARGRVMVVVHTQRSDTSQNALYLARAIAPKF